MAWNAPITFVGNAQLTAAQLNAQLRDNLLETMPGKATIPGSYFVTTGPNTVSQRNWFSFFADPAVNVSSTSYTNAGGPAIWVPTTSRALVLLSANMASGIVNSTTHMSVAVSGATTIGANDERSLAQRSTNISTPERQMMKLVVFTNLNPGENTFTSMCRVTSGTGVFQRRRLTVLPF